jgi:hypothetical protein
LKKGHWRLQRDGKNNELGKLIWIEPYQTFGMLGQAA